MREHARFCTVVCRDAWNRGHMGDPAADKTFTQAVTFLTLTGADATSG